MINKNLNNKHARKYIIFNTLQNEAYLYNKLKNHCAEANESFNLICFGKSFAHITQTNQTQQCVFKLPEESHKNTVKWQLKSKFVRMWNYNAPYRVADLAKFKGKHFIFHTKPLSAFSTNSTSHNKQIILVNECHNYRDRNAFIMTTMPLEVPRSF